MKLPVQKTIPGKIFSRYMRDFPIPCVDVVFFNKAKNKILLFKRNNEPLRGTYFTTGGRILKNEGLLPAAIRKAKEETGISIDSGKLIFGGVLTEIYKNSAFKGVNYHAVLLYFGYLLDDAKIKLDDQHSEYKWFSVHDRSIHPFVKKRIRVLSEKFKTLSGQK